mmetsp:Transcript_81824/g.227898  ORF Transcript_81824/g.227898 Transcript_81824/m.227898 type:complete len:488 (+) Transcript_81824:163-1626(+)
MLSGIIGSRLLPVRCCCAQDVHGPHAEILDESCRSAFASSTEVVEDGSGLTGSLPRGPRERTVPTYHAWTPDPELEGDPLMDGTILRLELGDRIQEVKITLHRNGLSIASVGKKTTRTTYAWSPFSLIEKCQVKHVPDGATWAVFKLTIYRVTEDDRTIYFATHGERAEEDRDKWVGAMAFAIGQVTQSLFPPHAINVLPMPSVPMTQTRIMASYLLQFGETDNVRVVYGELHSYVGGEASLTLYKDEWCDHEVVTVVISGTSIMSTRQGVYCTVFGIDELRFCARTREEKALWIRALSNIKVKLIFKAPDPDESEITVFRDAVKERVDSLGPLPNLWLNFGSMGPMPLLEQARRLPDVTTPRGDTLVPEPIDDAAECNPQPGAEQEEDYVAGDAASLAKEDQATTVSAVSALRPEDCRHIVTFAMAESASFGESTEEVGNDVGQKMRAEGTLVGALPVLGAITDEHSGSEAGTSGGSRSHIGQRVI